MVGDDSNGQLPEQAAPCSGNKFSFYFKHKEKTA